MKRLVNAVNKYRFGYIGMACMLVYVFVFGASSVLADYYSDVITNTPSVVHYWQLNEVGPQPLVVADLIGGKNGTNYYGYPANVGAGVDTVKGPSRSDGFIGISSNNLAAEFNSTDKTRMIMNDPDKLGGSKTFSSGVVSNLSMTFWLKLNTLVGDSVLAGYQDTAGGGRYVFTLKKNINGVDGYTLYIKKSDTTQVTLTIQPSQDLLWHHFAMTWDGITVKAYWDGKFMDAVSGSAGALRTPTELIVGGDATISDSRYFNGSIDEFAIFDQTLSAADIAEQYKAAEHFPVYATAVQNLLPCHYWRFSETNGSAFISDSLGDKTGTYNAPTLGVAGPRPTDGFGGFTAENTSPLFDGVADFITFSDPDKLGSSKAFSTGVTNITVIIWFRMDDYNNDLQVIGGYQEGSLGAKYSFLCQYDSSTYGFRFYIKDDGGIGFSNTPGFKVTDMKWHMLVWSWDGTTMRMYMDGGDSEVTITGASSGGLYVPEQLTFGKGENLGRFFEGQLDEIAIFDKTLTADDITTLYNAALNIPFGTVVTIK